MSLRLDEPVMLLFLLTCIPVLWLGIKHIHMKNTRKVTVLLARVILLTLLTLMLAGASIEKETRTTTVIGIIDVSGSVRDFVRLPAVPEKGYGHSNLEYLRWWMRQAIKNRGPDDRFGLIVFDGSTYVVSTPTKGKYDDEHLDIRLTDGTDLEQALRLAMAMFPPDSTRRIILVSDGNETRGDAIAAIRQISAGTLTQTSVSANARNTRRNIPIDVLPLPYRINNEVVLESLDVPPTAAEQSTVMLRATLNSTDNTTGLLQLTAEGIPLDLNGNAPGTGKLIKLKKGRNVQLISVPLGKNLIHRFELYFQPTESTADTLVNNNHAEAVTVTPGQGSVLIVDNDEIPSGDVLQRTLSDLDIRTKRIRAAQLPTDLLSLQAYDLIILNNTPAEQIARSTQEAIAEYVTRLGGGLVMVGGTDSFGAGGWKGTDIEPILPVRLDLPEEIIIPSAAVVFVLDNSGSMGHTVFGSGKTKQEIANEGAALAIQTLDKTDLISVITFNSASFTVVPLEKNANPDKSADIVRSIAPGGGTNLYPALKKAYDSLAAIDAHVKHVIVLTDGKSSPGPFEDLALRMHDDGITLSTIAVGNDADLQILQNLAFYGGGEFYFVSNPNVLPRIFIKEVRVVRKPLVRLGKFKPQILPTGSPITLGIQYFPDLTGIVLTQPRDDKDVILAASDPDGMPLLAHWNIGLGKVAAFTSSADQSWAARWITDPVYSRFWNAITRVIARPSTSRESELVTEFTGNELHMRLDASDNNGKPIDLLTVPGIVYTPDGQRREVTMEQTGPGTYEASIPAEQAGSYVMAITPRKGSTPLAPVVGAANKSTGPEYGRLTSNIGLLKRIAELTGGRLLDLNRPEKADLYNRDLQQPIIARTPIWQTLLWWSLTVFLLDVATRRIAWDRFVSKEAAREFARQAAESVRSRGKEATATLGSLKARSEEFQKTQQEITQSTEKLTGDGGQLKPIPVRERSTPSPEQIKQALQDLKRKAKATTAESRKVEKDKPGDQTNTATETTANLLRAKRRARRRLGHSDKDET